MGLTERHRFKYEERELTDRQLEDAVSIQDRVYKRGYYKGYSDGCKEKEAKIRQMSEWHSVESVSQGWQCPICGAIYSPMTMQCFNCTGWKKSSNIVSTGTEATDLYKEYMNHKNEHDQEET